MKAIVLAGGYAKRMWPLTKVTSKMLLTVSGKPMINYVLDKLNKIESIDEIFVSTNQRFAIQFDEWRKTLNNNKVKLIVEETICEEQKLGAIKGLSCVVDKEKITDDCIVIAGDNLFDANLNGFLDFAKNRPSIALYDVKDKVKAALYGIVTLDEGNKIINFKEKPNDPSTTLSATCCYFLPKESLKYLAEYLKQGNLPDAPGYFIQWLHKKIDVFGYVLPGQWYDIGDIDSYNKVQKEFSKH